MMPETEVDKTAYLRKIGAVIHHRDEENIYTVRSADGKKASIVQRKHASVLVDQLEMKYDLKKQLAVKLLNKKVMVLVGDTYTDKDIKECVELVSKIYPKCESPNILLAAKVKEIQDALKGIEDSPPPSGGAGGSK
jgi:hypothetical protein